MPACVTVSLKVPGGKSEKANSPLLPDIAMRSTVPVSSTRVPAITPPLVSRTVPEIAADLGTGCGESDASMPGASGSPRSLANEPTGCWAWAPHETPIIRIATNKSPSPNVFRTGPNRMRNHSGIAIAEMLNITKSPTVARRAKKTREAIARIPIEIRARWCRVFYGRRHFFSVISNCMTFSSCSRKDDPRPVQREADRVAKRTSWVSAV